MKDMVEWLASVENRAAILYAQAAHVFAADREFATFLRELEAEEEKHLELLQKVTDSLSWESMAEACISLDEAVRKTTEGPFDRARVFLKSRNLNKTAMLEVIAEAEFSEWNDLFLYVVDTIKGQGRDLQKAIAEIEHHRQEIETFIASFPWGEKILQKTGRLQPVWQRRILVMEDDHAIATLMAALLGSESEVVLAADGVEGLEQLRKNHFDVVVSDVDMPALNGIELYKQALNVDPDLQKRFVFYTATADSDFRRFIESTGCVLLTKPTPLGLLRKVIKQVAAAK